MSIKIEGVPDGWELVRIGTPIAGESFITYEGLVKEHEKIDVRDFRNYPIVRKIEPPKPVYVPWTFETCPRGVWVRHNTNGFEASVMFVSLTRVAIGMSAYSFDELLKGFTQLDGTPCGTIAESPS